jgi:GT2 family glycosyltransferase
VKKKVTLCIILVNYFNDQDTVNCVRSIMASDLDELPFIVVVDNGSTEDNLADLLVFYPEIKVIAMAENAGFAKGNNTGLKWAYDNLIFKYLFILNNDTLLLPDTIRILTARAVKEKDIAIFSPLIITAGTIPSIWYAGAILNLSRMTPVILYSGQQEKAVSLKDGTTEFVSGCAVFIDFERYGSSCELFDPFFFMYDEDVDFSLRMNNLGMKMYFVSEAIVIHKCQGSQVQDGNIVSNQLSPKSKQLIYYLKYTIKHRYYIAGKYFGGFKKASIFLTLTIYWKLKCIQYILNGRFDAAGITVREILTAYLPGRHYTYSKNRESGRETDL